jgi:hypothetical protein
MKKFIFLSIIVAISFSACRKPLKDVHDYFPKIETTSATVQPDGSVEVKGKVISEGAAPVEYMGFCVSTRSTPTIMESQTLADNNFTATYSGFNTGTKYYFRAWATNENGYSYGNVISLDSVVTAPVVAPCTVPANSVSIGGGNPTETYYSVDAPSNIGSEWEFQATSNSNIINFTFGSPLKTQVFTTTTSGSPGPNQVDIYFYSGFISGALKDGSSVYVNKTGATTYEITICNAPWSYNGSTFNFITRFTCPY